MIGCQSDQTRGGGAHAARWPTTRRLLVEIHGIGWLGVRTEAYEEMVAFYRDGLGLGEPQGPPQRDGGNGQGRQPCGGVGRIIPMSVV